MSISHLIAVGSFLLLAAAPAAADTLYEQGFADTSPDDPPAGIRKSGGFGAGFIDLNTDNGGPMGYLDANGEEHPTESSLIVDTGVELEVGRPCRFSLRLHKTGTRSTDYVGDVLYEVYRGDPESGGAMLASGTAAAGEAGELALPFRATAPGHLFLRIHAGLPENTGGYSQVEFDDLLVETTDTPAESG